MQKTSKGKWCMAKPKEPEIKVNRDELRKRLSPLQYRVTQEKATERPFSGEYLKKRDEGRYTCIVCNEEIFSSTAKYETSCGWPAFYDTVDTRKVSFSPDLSHVGGNLLLLAIKPDLVRTEVTCSRCGAHLGHVFDDGPKPTGKRYCINSAALKFREQYENNNNNNNNNNNDTDSMTSKSLGNIDEQNFTESSKTCFRINNINKNELNEKNAINEMASTPPQTTSLPTATAATAATKTKAAPNTLRSFIPTPVKSPNPPLKFSKPLNNNSSSLSVTKATTSSTPATPTANGAVRTTRKLPITTTPCLTNKSILSIRNNLRSVKLNNDKPIAPLLETNL